MLDSSTKHPENRLHLYDPVGLINESYSGHRPSSYTVGPRRQTVSYDNFVETTNDNNGLGLRSYNSVADTNSTGGLSSYDSFEVDSFTLRSCNESRSSESTNGDSETTMVEDPNDEGLRFVIGQNLLDDDQSDASTPRFWRPSSVTSPKSPRSPMSRNTIPMALDNSSLNPTSPKSPRSPKSHNTTAITLDNSSSNPTSPKSLRSSMNHNTFSISLNNSSPYPTSPKSMVNSPPIHPSNINPKSVHFSPLQPTSPKSIDANTYPPNRLNLKHQFYQTMPQNSRAQAIAKGRRELMDMVRDLPETFYELSLKDIVEQKSVEMEMNKEVDTPEDMMPTKEVGTKNRKETKKQKNSKKVKKSESKKKMIRSKSVDNGKFLLKTSVFPIFGLRKNKKKSSAAGSFKVAPMPKAGQKVSEPVKVKDKEWWRKKSCISSESDMSNGLSSQSMSSRSSSSSRRSNSSNGSRHRFKFLPICCLFNGRRIRRKK